MRPHADRQELLADDAGSPAVTSGEATLHPIQSVAELAAALSLRPPPTFVEPRAVYPAAIVRRRSGWWALAAISMAVVVAVSAGLDRAGSTAGPSPDEAPGARLRDTIVSVPLDVATAERPGSGGWSAWPLPSNG